MEYRQQRVVQSRTALDALAKQAQELAWGTEERRINAMDRPLAAGGMNGLVAGTIPAMENLLVVWRQP